MSRKGFAIIGTGKDGSIWAAVKEYTDRSEAYRDRADYLRTDKKVFDAKVVELQFPVKEE